MRLVRTLAVAATLAAAACSTRAPASPTTLGPRAPVAITKAEKIDRAALRARLGERRAEMFQRFLAYRETKQYPLPPGPGRQHIWIDARGYLCAAATMISADWGRDATIAAVDGQLDLRLADVRTGAIADWMLTSGLTQHELVAIQVPGFEYTPEPEATTPEVAIMYPLYVEVERQIQSQWEANLDLAVDQLMAKPALARAFLASKLPTAPRAG